LSAQEQQQGRAVSIQPVTTLCSHGPGTHMPREVEVAIEVILSIGSSISLINSNSEQLHNRLRKLGGLGVVLKHTAPLRRRISAPRKTRYSPEIQLNCARPGRAGETKEKLPRCEVSWWWQSCSAAPYDTKRQPGSCSATFNSTL